MRTVWKHRLDPGVTTVRVFGWPKVLHVGPAEPDADGPAVWIEQQRSGEEIYLQFAVVATGGDVPDDPHARHVGSAWCGPFMWHVYELTARSAE